MSARPNLSRFLAPLLIGAIAVAGSLALLPRAGAQNEPPNILLLIADDFGVESSVCYDDFPAPAPRLEAFCNEAVVFDNAWSSPICSPTRAGILTGRHSFRTGIGEQVSGQNGLEIADSEYTLPEVLDLADAGYATANFGKWHLGGDADKPNLMGWDHFSGLLAGGLNNYSSWTKVTNGVTTQETTYSTTAYVNEALAWIDDQNAPWLSWVAFNAPHTPFHLPPADLHTQNLSGNQADIDANPTAYYHAAIEALDTEIGRLIDSLDPATRDNTTIFFVGDNGNPSQVSDYGRNLAKGSIHEGGIHVPFMVWGAGVDGGRTSDALVGTVDIFATALELAGVDYSSVIPSNVQIDSKSFAHTLAHADGGVNEYIMSEVFGVVTNDNREGKTIRDDRYKVILFDNGNTRFYDLAVDRTGQNSINAVQRTAAEQAAYDELVGVLTTWTASAQAPPPDPLPHQHDPTPTPDGPTPTPGPIDLTALPLGDGLIATEPKVGELFTCRSNFNGGGAAVVGPWIDEANGTWDVTAKNVTVDGAVNWASELSVTVVGDSRMVSMNRLPDHPTGIFPVQSSDDAYFYDRNPNVITAQSIVEEMPAVPAVAAQAACAPAAVGFLLSGGLMFDGLDARGNDAAAHGGCVPLPRDVALSGRPGQRSALAAHGLCVRRVRDLRQVRRGRRAAHQCGSRRMPRPHAHDHVGRRRSGPVPLPLDLGVSVHRLVLPR